MSPEYRIHEDFARPGAAAAWLAVDDVVMGGRSASRLEAHPAGTALFVGVLSLEDGGGFGSVRSPSREWGFGGAQGIVLRVRSDGQRYKLGLRTTDAFDTLVHQAEFQVPAGAWQEVRLPWSAFQPRWRGRAVSQAEPLAPERVRSLGLLIADRQAGPFRLELAWIGSYPDPSRPA